MERLTRENIQSAKEGIVKVFSELNSPEWAEIPSIIKELIAEPTQIAESLLERVILLQGELEAAEEELSAIRSKLRVQASNVPTTINF